MQRCKEARRVQGELVDAVGLMQLECTLELNAMKQISMNQVKELETKIETLGGIDECAACREKTAVLLEFMSKVDSLIVAKIDNLTDQTRTSMNEVSNSVDRLSVVHSRTLESVDSNFVKMQTEAEKAALRSVVLEQQVSSLANTVVEIKDMLKKCPGELYRIIFYTDEILTFTRTNSYRIATS